MLEGPLHLSIWQEGWSVESGRSKHQRQIEDEQEQIINELLGHSEQLNHEFPTLICHV